MLWTLRMFLPNHNTPGNPKVTLIWYTDAFLIGRNSRYGVYGVLLDTRISSNLKQYSTIFQTEIIAIIACVHLRLYEDYKSKKILILSYSQVWIKTLNLIQILSKLVWEYLSSLAILSTINIVKQRLVTVHHGILGNEMWVFLAR